VAKTEVYLREEERPIQVPIAGEDKPDVSEIIRIKWQKSLTMLARIFKVPAALIMQVQEETMNVFLRADVPSNPYPPDGKDHLGHGLYCETVIGRNSTLYVPNSLLNDKWKDNPDVKLNMNSYLGMPLTWPDGEYFGTICVLDSQEVPSGEEYRELMRFYKGVIELDLEREMYIQELRADSELRIREVSHRVKNHLAAVNQIIQLSNAQSVSPKELLKDVEAKLMALARLHDQLCSADENARVGDHLRTVAQATMEIQQGPGRLEFFLKEDFEIPHRYMLDLGIAVNELINNAVKYGCKPGQKDFVIRVSLIEEEDGQYCILVQDNGQGFSAKYLADKQPQGTGVGTILLGSLAKQLGGSFQQYNEDGAVNSLRFRFN
jgi:two-component sensor histidine kinase